jgi:hypothetical protein
MQTASLELAPTRKQRFQRANDPIPFQLTDRDAEIILFVGLGRFRSSEQIRTMFDDRPTILRRLHRLYHNGYLDRPEAQKEYFRADGGSWPHVYALADKGARFLNERYALMFPETDWRHKNASVGRPFIAHTLAIGDMHVAITTTTRTRPDIELIDAKTLVTRFPKAPVSPENPFMWKPNVTRNGTTTLIPANPDYAFALGSRTVSAYHYLVEVDRGTMPIKRASYSKTSIVRKFDGYLHGFRAKLHTELFGWKSLRFLFVTNSQGRADNMRAALADLTHVRNERQLFYFTHADAIANGNALADVWIDGNGETRTLIA